MKKNEPIEMTDQVISYKEHIRKIVDASTNWEINRWSDWHGQQLINDLLAEVGATPIRRASKWLARLMWFMSICVLYYFLTPIFFGWW